MITLEKPDPPEKPPTCYFGNPFPGNKWCGHHHCPACFREGMRLLREFKAGVESGRWDCNGYTPNEAKAARKKGTYRSIPIFP